MASTKDKAPLLQFFENYSPEFVFDPKRPANAEFKRLCEVKGWKWKKTDSHTEGQVAESRFKTALVEKFNQNYGTQEDNLQSWQTLCAMIKIDPIPNSLQEARRAFSRTHVNLVELTQGYNNGMPIRIFDTVKELSKYTKKRNLVFPREDAKAGGLLRCLLRRLSNPSADDFGARRRRKKRVAALVDASSA